MSFYKEVPGRQTTLESTLKFDIEPKAGSTNPVTSDGVNTAITDAVGGASDALQEQIDDIAEKAGSGYTPKGEADVATLNGLSGQENGWLYTMTDAGTLTDGSLAVVAGDTVAWDEANRVWYKAMDYAPRQYGTNEVHNLATTITAFRTGDVIPVDGPSGTAKMSKDTLLAMLIHTGGHVSSSNADTIFGVDRNFKNASVNTMYTIPSSVTINDRPKTANGILLTMNGDTSSLVRVQYFYVTDGSNDVFYRCKWGGGSDVYSAWKNITDDTSFLRAKGLISNATDAVSAFGNDKDVGNANQNTIYTILTASGCVGLPTGYTQGTLITCTGFLGTSARVQIFVKNESGEAFIRSKWGSGGSVYSTWVCITEDKNALHCITTITSSALAEQEFGVSKSANNAKMNTIYTIDSSDVVDVPYKQGVLMTWTGTSSGAAAVQMYVVNRPANVIDLYYRIKWSNTWQGWHKVNANAPDVIQTFEKIGVAGDSLSSGESVYKDSNDVAHYVDMYENSYIQLWAKKHGIKGFNFSVGGMSTKYWLTNASCYPKAQLPENKCKVYFTLFGGSNDQRDWDGLTGLGTIADVHVGNEELNAESFYGNFSKIIASLQALGGQKTKVICFTMPLNFGAIYGDMGLSTYLQYRQAIMDIVALYDSCYCVDLYGDYVLENIVAPYKYIAHFSALGYKLIADRIEQRVNEYVAQHPNDFQDVQWIGTNYDVAEWY